MRIVPNRAAATGLFLSMCLVIAACGDAEPADTTSDTPSTTAAGSSSTAASDTTSPPEEGEGSGGEITVVNPINPASLDPVAGSSGGDHQSLYPVYDRLINFDPDTLEPLPGLAASWSYPDEQTLVLELQEGVTFHDGTPFDAEAVKFNLERAMTMETSTIQADLSMIESIEATAPLEATINLNRPDSSLLLILADRAGMMVSPTAVEASGEDFGRQPVGTGPFTFIEWIPNDRMVLEKNSDYWQEGLPSLDGITFRYIGDTQTANNALQAGEVDVVLKVAAADVETLQSVDGIEVVVNPSLLTDGCYFNYSKPPFDNADARRAFALAINREDLNSLFAFDQATPASQVYPPGYWAADPSLADTFTYDADEVQDALDAAGYSDGMTITGLTFDSSPEIRKFEIIQAQLAEAGIELTFDVMEAAAVASTFFENLEGDVACASWSGRPDPSQTANSLYASTSFYNAGKYASPGMDEALADAAASQDQAERATAFSEVIRLAQEDVLWVPLLHEPDITAIADRVEALEPNLYGKIDVSFLQVEE